MKRDLERILDGLLSGSPVDWIVFVALVVAIGVAVWGVGRYRASLRGDADPAAADALLVRQVREMRDRGQVSEEEYRSLKGRVKPLGETSPGAATGPTDAMTRRPE